MKLTIAEKPYDVPHMSVADLDDHEADLETIRGAEPDGMVKRKAVVNVVVKFLKSSYPELQKLDERAIKSSIPNYQVSAVFGEMINGPPKDMAQPVSSA